MNANRQPSELLGYQLAVANATGERDPRKVALIEESMKVDIVHGRLGHLTGPQFQKAAREAEELLRVRGVLPMPTGVTP